MVFNIVQRGFLGCNFGGIITFLALTFLKVKGMDVSVPEIWMNMLGCLLAGFYFGAASLIFDVEEWSPLKQTVFHFTLSIAIFFPIATIIGWVPLKPLALLTLFGIFVLVYVLIWLGIRLYLKKLEAAMNASIKKK